MSWSDSQTYCSKSSANLANIGSKQENEFIFINKILNSWIGLREVANNRLNWIDDGTEPVFLNWKDGQPIYEDGREDCVVMKNKHTEWRTRDCTDELNFVCERGKTGIVNLFFKNRFKINIFFRIEYCYIVFVVIRVPRPD